MRAILMTAMLACAASGADIMVEANDDVRLYEVGTPSWTNMMRESGWQLATDGLKWEVSQPVDSSVLRAKVAEAERILDQCEALLVDLRRMHLSGTSRFKRFGENVLAWVIGVIVGVIAMLHTTEGKKL